MLSPFPVTLCASGLVLLCLLGSTSLSAQQPSPLPDAPALLRQVEAHQAQMEKVRENYTFLERTVITELKKDGTTKKTETEEDEVFYVNGHQVQRKVKKDGKDLSPSEQQKETEHVTKAVEKAQNTPPGQSQSDDEISVGRMLQIMKYSAPRREMLDGRPTIVLTTPATRTPRRMAVPRTRPRRSPARSGSMSMTSRCAG